MKKRWNIFITLIMAICILLQPTMQTLAEEEGSRTGIPRLNNSEVKFNKKSFFGWFGLKDTPDENVIEEFVLAHRKLNNVDYTQYDLICDFVLKSKAEDGVIATSDYSYVIDFDDYEKGIIDSALVYFGLREDYYEHVFNYRDIVKNAAGYEEEDITGKGNYIYNTVISQVDFYLKRKSDGELGEARRFTFTWDSDFWSQNCVKIDFSWYDHDTDIQKDIGFVEDESGVDGYASGSGNSHLGLDGSVWDDIMMYLVAIPAGVIAFLKGFGSVTVALKDLIIATFPFIPVGIVNILIGLLYLGVALAIYKLVKGLVK